MVAKFVMIMSVFIHCCLGGVVPAVPAVATIPAAYSVPYASSYSASTVNHAVAVPVAQPIVAAPAIAAPVIAPIAAYNTLPYSYAPTHLIAG